MIIYSHNYSLPAKVSELLYNAYHASRQGRTSDAEDIILVARVLLEKYLSTDNMVPDDDCADGWIRRQDFENARSCDTLHS